MSSIRRQARFAGLLYLLACIPAPFCLLYVPSVLFVPGDATATADHIRASEGLLRLGMACEFINAAAFIFAVLALYRLFKGVDEPVARAMVILFVVSVPISFLNVLNDIGALILAHGASFLSVFDKGQRDALAHLFLRLHSQGLHVSAIFWGLWLFPFGMLVIRSGFIPRVLGVVLMIAGIGYVANSLTFLILPQYARLVGPVAPILEFGEAPMILWLLIRGARDQPSHEQSPSAAVA
jgi:hypothetical protein